MLLIGKPLHTIPDALYDRHMSKSRAKSQSKKTARPGSQGKRAKRLRSKLDEEARIELFARLKKSNPEPKGELEYVNNFTMLVAVVLSAQATDIGVNRATRALFRVADTPEKMLRLGEKKVQNYVKTIGLYRNKAKNVVALSEKLINEFGSEVPDDRDALESLPGVGRKTANVVLNNAFGEPTMAVDTHIFRISNRTGLAPGKNPIEVEEALNKFVPEPFRLHAHHWLILHGRYICKARKPDCHRCQIADICVYKEKTI